MPLAFGSDQLDGLWDTVQYKFCHIKETLGDSYTVLQDNLHSNLYVIQDNLQQNLRSIHDSLAGTVHGLTDKAKTLNFSLPSSSGQRTAVFASFARDAGRLPSARQPAKHGILSFFNLAKQLAPYSRQHSQPQGVLECSSGSRDGASSAVAHPSLAVVCYTWLVP